MSVAAKEKPNPVSDLCVSCGMCCDGSIFSYAPLDPGETFDKVDLDYSENGVAEIPLPCSCFEGKCTVYDVRPSICRTYLCDTAYDLKRGRIDLKTAQTRIELLREKVDFIRKHKDDYARPMVQIHKEIVQEYKSNLRNRDYMEKNWQVAMAAFRYKKLLKKYIKSKFRRRIRKLRFWDRSDDPI